MLWVNNHLIYRKIWLFSSKVWLFSLKSLAIVCESVAWKFKIIKYLSREDVICSNFLEDSFKKGACTFLDVLFVMIFPSPQKSNNKIFTFFFKVVILPVFLKFTSPWSTSRRLDLLTFCLFWFSAAIGRYQMFETVNNQ